LELYVTSKLSHAACPRRLQRIVRSCRLFFGEGLLQFLHVIQDPSLVEERLVGSVETKEEEEILSSRYPVRFLSFWWRRTEIDVHRAIVILEQTPPRRAVRNFLCHLTMINGQRVDL